MEIVIAKTAGFCFGVKRALGMVQEALKEKDCPLYSLGPPIHNPRVVSELMGQGLQVTEEITDIPAGRLVIRSHGAGPSVFEAAAERKLTVIDTTCPFVKKVQQLAVLLAKDGYQVVICGELEHAEVKGVLEAVGGKAIIVDEPDQLPLTEITAKVGLVSQTTQAMAVFQRLVDRLLPYVSDELRIFNTICRATMQRQQEVAVISREADLVVVVGGRNSANTLRLAEISRSYGTLTYQVESPDELRAEWFTGRNRIGITAGASTPDEQIQEVVWAIRQIDEENRLSVKKKDDGGNGNVLQEQDIKQKELLDTTENGGVSEAQETDAEMSMDALFTGNQYQELIVGKIITAKVILVRDDAVFVDVGSKSDFTIPVTELSTKPVFSAKEVVKVGDTIKVMVARSGDEDKILLSKRLVDLEQVWIDLEDAFKQGVPVTGTVTGIVKGGLNLDLHGIRAFMPASQATLGPAATLENLVSESFSVKVMEFNRSKRQVVVSRRVLLAAEQEVLSKAFFESISEGERRTGTVTRITDFGVFVNLGSNVEGLIHVSELSWQRVKSAREVLNEGDKIEVLVLKVDRDTKRISLSLKQTLVHPWEQAMAVLKEGDVYEGTVARMESFGAFINLLPGVDGLVHISQIADRRIAKPDEVLKTGQKVMAKILKIDTENRKISLSLKQATEQKDQEVAEYLSAQDEASVTRSLGEVIPSETKEG